MQSFQSFLDALEGVSPNLLGKLIAVVLAPVVDTLAAVAVGECADKVLDGFGFGWAAVVIQSPRPWSGHSPRKSSASCESAPGSRSNFAHMSDRRSVQRSPACSILHLRMPSAPS